ncbi:MAG: cytochrome-c peroxidase [Bacteroidota bacterium]
MEIPAGWPNPIYEFKNNPLTFEKIQLGRQLFYDPLLSADGTISCASCHSPYSAFAHNDHALSHGIHDSIGMRNAPSLFNLAWRTTFMLDGAINHLDVQALAPIHHPGEMGSDLNSLVISLSSSKKYRDSFQRAYGDTSITGERTLKVIAQFLLTLVSNESKYDSVMAGLTDFNEKEANGYRIFKSNCNSCHKEPLFMTNEFTESGISAAENSDQGRYTVTGDSSDLNKFQIPSLRNISYTYPYMHDGRFKRPQDVINQYSEGDYRESVRDLRLKNIQRLSPDQKIDLLAFLYSLNDRKFIFNSKHVDPASYSNLQNR